MPAKTIYLRARNCLNKTPTTKGGKNGFSQIELLFAILIIVVLSGIIIPAVQSVRESAAYTQSVSNLRQLGTAMSLFLNDNRGYFPPSVNRSSDLFPGLAGVRWVHALDDYIDGFAGQVYRVPAFYSPLAPGIEGNRLGASFIAGVGLYGYNAGLDDPSLPHGLMYALLANPSEVIVFGEKRFDVNSGPHLAGTAFWPDAPNGLATNYRQGAPVLWANWSVSAVLELPPHQSFHPEIAY